MSGKGDFIINGVAVPFYDGHYIKNGQAVRIYDGYYIKNGVAVKIYQSYDCQAQNYNYGGIAADGSLSYDRPASPITEDWFHLHFDLPVAIANLGDILIKNITISLGTFGGATKSTLIAVYSDSNFSNQIAQWEQDIYQYYGDATLTTLKSGNYTDFYFAVGVDTAPPITASALAGSLYVAGQQIKEVELI